MQCVILAAGRGTRMGTLTDSCPKPLLKVAGKPILSHIIDALPEEIDEVILVVGYRADMIKAYYGTEYERKTITYRTQENPKGGTGDALLTAKDAIRGRFLFMYADDIHGKEALKKVVSLSHAMLGTRVESPEKFGVLILNSDHTLKEIIEKPKHPTSNLVNIGGCVVLPDIFDFTVPVSSSGELYVTDMLTAYAKQYPVEVVTQDVWIPIGYPEDLEHGEEVLAKEGR